MRSRINSSSVVSARAGFVINTARRNTPKTPTASAFRIAESPLLRLKSSKGLWTQGRWPLDSGTKRVERGLRRIPGWERKREDYYPFTPPAFELDPLLGKAGEEVAAVASALQTRRMGARQPG